MKVKYPHIIEGAIISLIQFQEDFSIRTDLLSGMTECLLTARSQLYTISRELVSKSMQGHSEKLMTYISKAGHRNHVEKGLS